MSNSYTTNMYGNTQSNSLDFGQSGGLNKTRKMPFAFNQNFEANEDDYTGGMGVYSRPTMEKEQYQYYSQPTPLQDPTFFGSQTNNVIGNNSMLPPLLNTTNNTANSINRLSHTVQLQRPQQPGLSSHNSFAQMPQLTPGSAVIGSPSRGSGMLLGGQGQPPHGVLQDTGNRNAAPGMMNMGMGMPISKHNVRLGGIGISQPGNYPGGLSSIDSTVQNLDIDFPTLRGMGIRRDIPQSLPINQNIPFTHNPNSQIGFHSQQHQLHPVQATQVPEPAAEFQMHHEDFPALPGLNADTTQDQQPNSVHVIPNSSTTTPITPGGVSYQTKLNTNLNSTSTNFSTVASAQLNTANDNRNTLHYDLAPGSGKERIPSIPGPIGPPNKGMRERTKDGVATLTIPDGMVRNQFGMFGLLTFIRAAETDSKLVCLALGSDLTTLGLNLNSPDSLFASFASPWSDTPARPQDIDYHVPQEYIINSRIREKLAPIKPSRYGDELLFYLYYNNGNDILQVYANYELHTRNWRYHKEERVWIMKVQGLEPVTRSQVYEQGTYLVFDVKQFKKVHREMTVEYSKLEDRPYSNMNPQQQPQQQPQLHNNNNGMYTYPKPDLN